jgi:hypothetical protein
MKLLERAGRQLIRGLICLGGIAVASSMTLPTEAATPVIKHQQR